MNALFENITNAIDAVIVHTVVGGPSHSSPIFYPAWLPVLLIGLLIAMSAMLLRYRSAYKVKKNEEMRLYRQTHFQGQMLAVINHDIQTPLHYLERSLEQIDRHIQQKSDDQVIRDTSEVAFHAVRQIRRFTGDLLVFVKMQLREHDENLVFEPVNISAVAEETLEFYNPTINSKGLRARNDIPPGLMVSTNANLFSVILHNLVDNALKNTVEGEVIISASQISSETVVTVTDTGSGMKKETADWMNTESAPWQYLDENGAPGGSGIGLVIIKEFCVMLGIRIEVKSNAGKGTVTKLSFLNNNEANKNYEAVH